MNISNESVARLRKAIKQAVDNQGHEEDFDVITDLHVHVDQETGEVTVSDDTDSPLAETTVEEWQEIDLDTLETTVADDLHELLEAMDEDRAFHDTIICKPFSFVLEDDARETIDELYIVDDDNIYLSGDLLAGMDEELDEFITNLLKND